MTLLSAQTAFYYLAAASPKTSVSRLHLSSLATPGGLGEVRPWRPAARAAAVYAALAVAALVTVIGGIFPDSLMFWAVAPG